MDELVIGEAEGEMDVWNRKGCSLVPNVACLVYNMTLVLLSIRKGIVSN